MSYFLKVKVISLMLITLMVPLQVALGFEVSSGLYSIDAVALINGGGAVSSANFFQDLSAVGEGVSSVEQGVASLLRLFGGQLKLFFNPYWEFKFLIKDLLARTDVLGPQIKASTWQRDDAPYFSWSIASEGDDVVEGYSVALDSIPDTSVDTPTLWYQFAANDIATGKHTFYVFPILRDESAEALNLLSFEIWVDTLSPVISQIEPESALLTNNNLLAIRCNVFDADSGLDAFATILSINGSSLAYTYNEQTHILECKPAGALAEGKNSVLLKAYDLLGNNIAKAWDFMVDSLAPFGSIKINGSAEVTRSAYVVLDLSCEDNFSGVETVYISNDGVFDTELNNPIAYSAVIKDWILQDPDVDGIKRVYIKLKDAAGNISGTFWDDIELKLATADTRIISGPPSVTADTQAVFSYEATKAGCLFRYKLDNGEWSGWMSQQQASFFGLAAGNHYFYVQSAFDLNADSEVSLDEVDATPAGWVWTLQTQVEPAGGKGKTLYWRR